MQKFRLLFSPLLVFFLCAGVFAPVFSSFSREDIYDYSEYREKINTSFSDIKNKVIEKDISFDTPRTTFTLGFPGYTSADPEDITVEWSTSGSTYMRTLDIEEGDDTSLVSTAPFVTFLRSSIHVKISFKGKIPPNIELLTTRSDSIGSKIVFHPGSFIEQVSAEGTHIISRSEWGADEALRYISPMTLQKRTDDWILRGRTPRIIEETIEEKNHAEKENNEIQTIRKSDPDAATVTSVTRRDGMNKLFWPITKTLKVNRVIIHHTAESLDQDADDATLIRAIYYYHTRVKGWGDIGYNYIIGQRGAIYEGRAGGDYTEGAHVYGNNVGSVGISMIGNYDLLTVNRDQKAGLIDAVSYVAQKYGINLKESVTGAHLCSKDKDCTWEAVQNLRLAGHRDYASTGCPGKNLYALIPEIREIVVGKVGNLSPILNPESRKIDPIDPEDEVQYVVKDTLVSPLPTAPISTIKSSGGKPIKIRLSYPDTNSISLIRGGQKIPVLRLDGKKIVFAKDDVLLVGKVGNDKISLKIGNNSYTGHTLGFSSDLIRIPSWTRIPSWDTTRKYNDNIFRSRILVRNQVGNLLVTNELPIEDYLKGLGEVSNSDLPEKIKTIIVGARTYAYYYIDPKYRKYGTSLYDGSDNPDEFQKYLGYGYEARSPDVSRYVDQTKGQTITYKNELIKSWYFSSSDGRTRSYKEYCESNGGKSCIDIPYLQSVDDPGGVGHTRSGHGVGISGIGATYAASFGKTYRDIISYYLKGVEIKNINTLK